MITQGKLKIFLRYHGDVDMWARLGSSKEKSKMQSTDWYLIESLMQDIRLVKRGLATNEFAQTLYTNLQDNCDNEQTKEQLEKIAEML